MKIKKIKLITEGAREANGATFINSTEDQFPYVESAINILDNNFKWWKENWAAIEQLISKYLSESRRDAVQQQPINIASRFTVFHGADEKVEDVVWTGPAIVYTLNGATSSELRGVKNKFGGIYKGKKVFVDVNQLIFLFG